MTSPDDIINKLGGTTALAAALGLDPSTVSCWRDRGIPSSQWVAVKTLAAERGVAGITLDFLAEFGVRKAAAEARA